jgi:hypothetical protein
MTEPEEPKTERMWILSRAEWVVLGKLVGIVAMALILLQANITFDYALAQFIYGRF